MVPAKRTLVGFLHPALDATSVIDMAARQLHDELLLFESLDADGTCLGALLHDESADPVDSGQGLGLDGAVHAGQ